MNKKIFIALNICYFIFDYFCIPYLPNPVLFGWMPLQMFAYGIMGIIACLLWGVYFSRFFDGQKRYK